MAVGIPRWVVVVMVGLAMVPMMVPSISTSSLPGDLQVDQAGDWVIIS